MPLIPNNNNNRRITPTFSLPDIKNLNVNLGNTGLNAFVTNQDLANNIINDQEDVDAINAERQGSIAKWGKGLSNVITGGGIEIAKAPGYLYGLGDWASTKFKSAEIDRAFNNTYLRDLEQLEEFTKGEVYVPKDVKEGNIFEKLWSSGFWGSTVADGAKFMVGMMGVSAATRSLGLGAKIATGIQGLTEAESITANGVKAGITLNKLSKGIDTGLNVALNTHIESAQEAKGVYDAIIKQGGSKELAGREAANNYLTNAVILFGPNMLFENQFFKNKFKGNEASTKMALDAFETGAAKISGKQIVANWTKNILLGIGSEAFWEEGMQLASEKYFTNRGVNATKGKLVDENEFSPWGIVKQYWDNIGTDEFTDSVLTGAILGTSGAISSSVKDTKRANRALNGYTTKYGYKMPGLKDLGVTLLKGGYDNLDGIYESTLNDDGTKSYKLNDKGKRVVNKDKFNDWVKANDALQLTAILAQKADSELGEAGVAIKNLFRDKGLMSKFQSYFDIDGGVELLKKIIDTKIQEEVFDSISQALDLKQSNAELKKDLLQKVDDMKELYDYNKSSFSKRFKLNPTTKKGSIEEQALNATKSDNYFTRFDHYTTQYSLNNRIKELEDKKNKLTFFGVNTVVNQKERVEAIDAEIKTLTDLVNNSILETNKLDSLEEQKKTYEDKLKELKQEAEKTEAVEAQKPQEVKNAEAMAEATAKANEDFAKEQEAERLAAEERANSAGEDGIPPRDTTDDDPNLSQGDDLSARYAAKNNVTNGNIMQYLLNKQGMKPDLAAKVENYLSLLDLEHPLVDVARLLADDKTSKDTLLELKKQGPEMFNDPSDALSLKAFNKIIDDRIKVLDKEEAERLEREKPVTVASIFNNANVLSRVVRVTQFYRNDVFDALLRDLPYEEFVKDLTFTYSKNTNKSQVQTLNSRVSIITPTHQFNLFYKDKQIGFVPGVDKYLFDGKLVTNENIDSLVGPVNFNSYFSKEEKYDVFKEMLNKQSVLNNNLKTLLGNNQFIRLNLEEFSQYADINLSAGELDIRDSGQEISVADLESDTFNYFDGNFVVVQNNIEAKPGENPFRILDPVPVVFKKDSQAKRIRTSDIQDEVTEALNKLQNRDNLGRYLLVVRLGNGSLKFIHLKGSKLDSVKQSALIDAINVRLSETVKTNTSLINDGKTLKTVTKSNTFNENFNKELNEGFMIALPQGFDMKIQVSPSGKITFVTSYKAQKHVAGQKNALGQSLDRNSVYQIADKPIVDMEDLLKHVKNAFKKAIQDHKDLLSDDSTTAAIAFSDNISSNNFRVGIPKELNAGVIKTLLTSVTKGITKRANINIIGKANVSAKPNVTEEEVLATTTTVSDKKADIEKKIGALKFGINSFLLDADNYIGWSNVRDKSDQKQFIDAVSFLQSQLETYANAKILSKEDIDNIWSSHKVGKNKKTKEATIPLLIELSQKYAELKALEGAKTVDIEAKKADIERRRQEEIDRRYDTILPDAAEILNEINAEYDAELARELYKEIKAGKLVTDMTVAEQAVADKYITKELRKSVDAELEALNNVTVSTEELTATNPVLNNTIDNLTLVELTKLRNKLRAKRNKTQEDTNELARVSAMVSKLQADFTANEEVDSTVTDLSDVENSDIEADKKYLQSILPDFISVQELDAIYNRFVQDKTITLGRFKDSVIYLGKNRKSTTKQHEAFHAVFRMLLSDTQINSLINEARQEKQFTKEEIANFKFNRPKYRYLDDRRLSYIMYEEYLAEGFEKWTKDRQFRTGNLIKAFYRRLSDIVKNLFNKQSEIEATYKKISSGKFKSSNRVNNRFTSEISSIAVDAVVRKTPLLSENNTPISRTFTSNESNMIVSMVYHQYSILKNDIQNAEIPKKELLDIALDTLKNRYSDSTVYYDTTNFTEEDYEKLDNMNFAFNNKTNRESIIKTITKRDKIIDAEFTEYENEVDEHDLDKADLMDKSANHDFKWENFGGIGSLSKRAKAYMNTVYYYIPDPLDKTKQIPVSVNGDKVYSGLVKALANSSDFNEMLAKMTSYNDGETQASKFISAFFEDCGIVYDKETNTYKHTKDSHLFYSVLKTFNRYNVLYNKWQVDADSKESRLFHINNTDGHKYQLNIWQRAFDEKYWSLLEDKNITSEKIKSIKEGMQGVLRDFMNAINEPELSTKDIYDEVERIHKDLKDKLGMELSKNTIKFSILANKENLDDETLLEFKANFADRTPIDAEDLSAIASDIGRGNNPFIKDTESVDEEEDGKVTKIEGGGSTTRLNHLAFADGQFNENVFPTSFRNAENKTVYGYQLPTFHLLRISDLAKQTFRNAFKNSTETNRNLLLQEGTEEYLGRLKVERLAGLNSVTYKEGSKIIDKTRTDERNKSFDKYTPKELASQLLDMWGSQKYESFYVGGKAVKKNMALHYIRVLEASSTADLVRLPVIENLINDDGTLSDKAVNLLYDIFLTEADNIYKAKLEINQIKGYLNNDGTPNIPQEEWEEKGLPIPILDYHYSIINGKINYEEVRGLKFFENKFLDTVPNSLKNAKEVKTENFTEKFENEIKVAIKAEYEKKAQNYIDSLVKLKVINEKKGIYTNNSLFNNFYNKIIEDRSTTEIDTNKIKDFYLNDFLNTYSINNLLFENEAKVFKDSIMQVKRARGSNAGGPSSETQEKTNVNVVILNDVDRNIKINDDDIGTVTTTDGQGIIFDYALKDLLRGLNKLDAKQEAFIDKIINGELTEADIFGSEGSITRKGQLISLKLVYNDGKNYYKLSVAIVTKDLLYYKGKPRAERMDLVRAYEKGKESKADMILFASTSKNTTGFISNDKHYFNNKSEAKFWRLQQENPSNKNNSSSPSQTENLIDSEQDLSLPVYGYGEKYKTIGDVVSSYQRNLALLKKRLTGNNINTLYDKTNILKDITPENYLDKLKELKTSIDNGTSDINLNDFVAQALSGLEGTGGNEQLLEFFSLDNNDEAKFNLNIASTYDKYVQLLIAHFNNSGFKLKIPGHTATLMSGYGMNVIEHNGVIIDSDTYNENPSAYSGAKFRRLKHNVEVKDTEGNVVTRYSECLFPAHFAQLFGLKIGDNKVDSRLLEFFGVRIPTQDKHSMVNLRVVGFLPAQMGSTIVVPDEIILLSGADFDIDKLYMQRYDFYLNENKEPVVYGTAVTDEDKFEEYKKWMLSNNKTVKNKFKNSLKNNNEYIQLRQIKKDLLSIIKTNKQLTNEEIDFINEYIEYTEELDASLSKESDKDFMETLKITKDKLDSTLDILNDLKFEKRVFTNEGKYGYKDLLGIIRITHLDVEKIYQVNLPESLLDKINSFKDVLKTIDEIYTATELEAIKETGLPFNLELFNELSKQGEQNPGVLHNNILEAKQILLSNDGIQKNKTANGGLSIGSTPASLDILKKQLLNDPMYKGVWNIITESLSANTPDGKIRAFSNLMEGAAGIGPIVNFEMIYTVLQKAATKYDFSPITINGVTYNDYGNLYTDSNSLNPTKYPGIRKFDIISTLVSAMTDNAKHELAAIFRISQDMLPVLAHMLILGVNISDALLIINNPIIAKYQERLKETKGHLRTKSEKKDLKAFTLIEDMIDELESNKSDESENKDENNLESQEKTPILAKDFELTSKALLEDANGTTNNVELQKALLLMLKDFKKDTALLNNVIQFTNKNKGLASDMEQFDKFEQAIKELGLNLSDEQFKKAKIPFDLRNTITKDMPVLAFYYKQVTRLRKQIMPYFLLSASSHFSSIYNSLYENLDNRNKHFKLKKEVTNAIKKDILSYISMLSYKKYLKDNGLTEKFENLDNYNLVHKKEGKDSIVDIYKKAKALDPTNPFINYVVPNPSHIPNKNRELVPNPNNWKKINLLSPSSKIERDSDYQTAVMDGFKTLYLNPQTKQAAIAIFNYLIVKDGLQYKNESIVNNIANFIFTDLSKSLDITLNKFKNSNLSDTEFIEVFGKTKNQMIKEFVDLYTINGHNSYQLQAVVGDTQKIYSALRDNVRGARRITEEESVDDKGKLVIDIRHGIKKVETTDEDGNKITKIKSEKLPFEEYKTVREEISALFGDKFFKEVEEDIQYTDAEDNTVKDSTRILYQFPYRFVIGNRTFRLESYSNSGKKLSVLDNFATGKFQGTRAVYVLDEGYHGNKNVTNLVVTEETQPLYTKDKNTRGNNSSLLMDEDFDDFSDGDNYSEEDNDDDFPGEASNSILDVLASREETTQPTTSVKEGVEISSNAKGLAAALTNPTELSKSKGNITQSYPIEFNGKKYKDVETAYQKLKDKSEAKTKPTKEDSKNYKLMVDLITAKLQQHPRLVLEITKQGGSAWILSSTHQPTKANTVWETGGQNWFIESLNDAYLSTQPNVTSKVKPTIDLSREWSGDLESSPVYTKGSVNTMRTKSAKPNEHFGNPWSEGGYAGTIKTSSVAQAAQNYKDWLLGTTFQDVKPEQRAWILDQINQGKLDGANLLYSKKLMDRGQGSHAISLAEVVEQLRSTQPNVETETTKKELIETKQENKVDTAKFQEFMLSNDIYSAIQMLGYKFDKSTSTFVKGQEIIKVEDTEAILKIVKEFSKDNNLKC